MPKSLNELKAKYQEQLRSEDDETPEGRATRSGLIRSIEIIDAILGI
jgi:hypothetical protein